MHEVVSAVPLAGFKLLLTFDDDVQKVFDMSGEFTGVFEYLKDPCVFNTVAVVHGAPTWFPPEGLEVDLCPDVLYRDSVLYIR